MQTNPSSPARHTLIVGFGNPLRGDDALGWEVASRLASSLDDPGVDIRLTMHLTPELLEPISQATLIIFIDATREGPPGEWTCEEVFPGINLRAHAVHESEVERLLEYSRQIFHARPRALLVTVSAATFEFSDHLSRATEEVIPEVIEFIRGQLVEAETSSG